MLTALAAPLSRHHAAGAHCLSSMGFPVGTRQERDDTRQEGTTFADVSAEMYVIVNSMSDRSATASDVAVLAGTRRRRNGTE